MKVPLKWLGEYVPLTLPVAELVERLTKGTGWLEIMGAGMVHPVVLHNGGYDPDRFSGFAFGMGPQRVAQLKYAIDDIRLYWANDLHFLRQF